MLEGCGGCCLTVVVIPLLCCGLLIGGVIYIYATAPDPPLTDNFKANLAEAQAFEAELARATNRATTQGVFDLNVNERYLSSWMALEGEDFADEHGHSFPFKNVQVGLDDGQITFYAELDRTDLIKLPLEVVLEPTVDDQGQLKFEIKEAHLSGLRVPNVILENVTGQFEDRLVQPFDDLPGNYYVYENSIVVEDGAFILQGGVSY
jgi:hypothetical protein